MATGATEHRLGVCLVVVCVASLADDDEPSQENGAWFQLTFPTALKLVRCPARPDVWLTEVAEHWSWVLLFAGLGSAADAKPRAPRKSPGGGMGHGCGSRGGPGGPREKNAKCPSWKK